MAVCAAGTTTARHRAIRNRMITVPSYSSSNFGSRIFEKGVARPEGRETPAYRFEACRSIQLSYGRVERRSTLRGALILSRSPVQPSRHARIGFCLGAFRAHRSSALSFGPVAQLAEQQTLNLR